MIRFCIYARVPRISFSLFLSHRLGTVLRNPTTADSDNSNLLSLLFHTQVGRMIQRQQMTSKTESWSATPPLGHQYPAPAAGRAVLSTTCEGGEEGGEGERGAGIAPPPSPWSLTAEEQTQFYGKCEYNTTRRRRGTEMLPRG